MSPFLPTQRSVMLLLSTTSILSCKRWFVNCLTVKFALALSDSIVGVEKMVWHWGQFSLMKVFSFSSLSRISLEVQASASFVPTWRIKWQGFLSSIGIRLCCMSYVKAPGKLRTLTKRFFPDKRSSRIPFIIESPAITVVFEGYWPWIVDTWSWYLTLILDLDTWRRYLILESSILDTNRRYLTLKKVDLKNFAKLAGKHLRRSLFFNKVAVDSNTVFFPWILRNS